MSNSRLALVAIVLVVLGGSYVRLVDLGRAHFNGDELDHYYAALSLQAGDRPTLPSGSEYTRGIGISRMVSFTLRYVDPPELAARLPSAAFGILSLLLMAAIAWSLGGPWAAVWATFLLAILPEAIVQSRMTRFYTYQLSIGLVAMYAGWRSLEFAGSSVDPDRTEWRKTWLWGLATVAGLLLATRVQLTTLSVALGWLVCVLVAAGADLMKRGTPAWRRSFPLQAAAIGLAGALLILVAFPGHIRSALVKSQFVGAWSGPGKMGAYYYHLSGDFPLIISLLPLVFLVVLFKKPRLAVYLGIWLAVPLLLHSIVFPWKGVRYVLLALPAMLVAAGIAAAAAFGSLRSWLSDWFEEKGLDKRRGRSLGTLIALFVSLFAIATTNAFNDARRIPPIPKPIDWSTARALIDSLPDVAKLPLGSSMGLPALYYWGELDFVVGVDFLEMPSAETGAMTKQADGAPDWYSGAATLTTASSIKERYPDADRIVIGIDTDRWRFDNIDASLRQALTADGAELCQGRCGDLVLYLWTPHQPDAAPPGDAEIPGSGETVSPAPSRSH